MTWGKHDFRFAVVVLTLSGAASLGHQLLWTRRMADLIGATGESNARVFGSFFLGVALGAAAAARFVPRLRRPWRTVAVVELGIALLSLPALLVNSWSASLWLALGPERLIGWPGAVLKLLLSVLIVLPPAVLLGMTLPILAATVCRRDKSVSRGGIWLYAAYTFGGALGIALVVGWLLHRLGAAGAMLGMIGLNVLAGVMCFYRDRLPASPVASAAPELKPASAAEAPPRRLTLLLLSFFSGAGVLAIEVAGLQLLNLKAPFSFYTPAAILFCVILLLACSAILAGVASRFFAAPLRGLAFCCAAASLALAVAPLLFLAVTAGRSGIGGHGITFAASLLKLGGVAGLSLGPGVLAAGMVFPLLIACLAPASAGQSQRAFAEMLAVNGVGGLLGAEAVHRLLLPALGVHIALGVLGLCYGLVALAVALRRGLGLRLAIPIGSVAGTCLLLSTSLKTAPIFLRGSTFNLVEVRSGREGTVAVAERPDVGRALFLDNHYMLGCTLGAPDMQRQAHLPLLLHRRPKQVCFIGLGTGITAAGALRHGAVESIDALELCPLVAAAAAQHFSQFNLDFTSNPKVRVHVEDARTYIASAPDRFDVIIGDLFTPWRPGEARLCSYEQFTAAKAALRPGGVYCQWLPLTQLTPEQFEVVAATFQRVFGEVCLFRDHLYSRSLPIALVGFKDARLNWEIVARRCESERAEGAIRDPLCRHAEGIAMLYLGTVTSEQRPAPNLNTLDNLLVELEAGWHLLAGNPTGYFAGTSDTWLKFLNTQSARIQHGGELPLALRHLPGAAQAISRWLDAHNAGDTNAPALRRDGIALMPVCILTDPDADWSLWPGHDPHDSAE
ncbi:MAG TPA: fused MFS/spermidine synthase [Verrucomicrobiae bacterium]